MKHPVRIARPNTKQRRWLGELELIDTAETSLVLTYGDRTVHVRLEVPADNTGGGLDYGLLKNVMEDLCK